MSEGHSKTSKGNYSGGGRANAQVGPHTGAAGLKKLREEQSPPQLKGPVQESCAARTPAALLLLAGIPGIPFHNYAKTGHSVKLAIYISQNCIVGVCGSWKERVVRFLYRWSYKTC